MITLQFFNKLFPTKGLNPAKYNLVRYREQLIAALNKFLPKYGINSYLRVCAFLAACGVETDYFKTTSEYASGWGYDISVNPRKAKELGNLQKGDGPKYKGSGIIQTTGKFNFFRVLIRFVKKLTGVDYTHNQTKALAEAARLNVNVIDHPELLRTDIEFAVEAACIFWEENNLNENADAGEFKQLNGLINRGDPDKMPLGWAKRNELYKKCLASVPKDFSFEAPAAEPAPVVTLPSHDDVQQPQQISSSDSTQADQSSQEPVADDSQPATSNDSFLSDAIDHNVSADDVKTGVKDLALKHKGKLVRWAMWLFTALEAGNVYAWLGVIILIGFVAFEIYVHRADLLNLFNKLKGKFTQ